MVLGGVSKIQTMFGVVVMSHVSLRGGDTLCYFCDLCASNNYFWGLLGFGFIFPPTLLLSNFLICTYFRHRIFFIIFFQASNFNTLYTFKILVLQNFELEKFACVLLKILNPKILFTILTLKENVKACG